MSHAQLVDLRAVTQRRSLTIGHSAAPHTHLACVSLAASPDSKGILVSDFVGRVSSPEIGLTPPQYSLTYRASPFDWKKVCGQGNPHTALGSSCAVANDYDSTHTRPAGTLQSELKFSGWLKRLSDIGLHVPNRSRNCDPSVP